MDSNKHNKGRVIGLLCVGTFILALFGLLALSTNDHQHTSRHLLMDEAGKADYWREIGRSIYREYGHTCTFDDLKQVLITFGNGYDGKEPTGNCTSTEVKDHLLKQRPDIYQDAKTIHVMLPRLEYIRSGYLDEKEKNPHEQQTAKVNHQGLGQEERERRQRMNNTLRLGAARWSEQRTAQCQGLAPAKPT